MLPELPERSRSQKEITSLLSAREAAALSQKRKRQPLCPTPGTAEAEQPPLQTQPPKTPRWQSPLGVEETEELLKIILLPFAAAALELAQALRQSRWISPKEERCRGRGFAPIADLGRLLWPLQNVLIRPKHEAAMPATARRCPGLPGAIRTRQTRRPGAAAEESLLPLCAGCETPGSMKPTQRWISRAFLHHPNSQSWLPAHGNSRVKHRKSGQLSL